MKRGISTYVFGDGLLDPNKIDALKDKGIETVEIWSAAPHFSALDRERMLQLRGSLALGGIPVHSFHIGFQDGAMLGSENDVMRKIAVATTVENLNIAAFFDAKWLVLHADNGQTPIKNKKLASDAFLSSLTELLREAQQMEVGIALDFAPSNNRAAVGGSMEELRKICACFPGAPIGICLSTAHMDQNGDVPETVKTAGEYLVSAYLTDTDGRSDCLVPYQGADEWDPFIEALRNHGYKGPCLIETRSNEPIDVCLDQIVQAFDRLGL